MCESMLLVRGLLSQLALANKSLLLSDIDWLAIQELTECLKPVYGMITAIQLKKLTAGGWQKCRIQLQHKSVNNCSLALAMLHAMEQRETTLMLLFWLQFMLIQGIRYF